jgi:hypothetical protein
MKKACNSCVAGFFVYLGWLMGLEPTTTGITILRDMYFLLLMRVVLSFKINYLFDTTVFNRSIEC